jgi:drug/metabolite transporter (DMT)-like permease
LIGEFFALASTFAFGFASVAIAKNTRASTGEGGVFLCAIATAVISGLGWAFAGNGRNIQSAQIVSGAVAWFVVSGLLATVFGRLTFYKSIEYAGAVRASMSRRLTPFISLFLGWAVFGETMTIVAATGMGLIGASYLLLYYENRRNVPTARDDYGTHGAVSYGLALGIVSAFLYAASYAARKSGLQLTPEPYLGAFSGALTAIVVFVGAAFVSERYRTIIRTTLLSPPPWLCLAAILISLGQITQFVALTYIGIGRVAFINSAEVFISAFLAVFVFRTEPIPHQAIMLAMAIGTIGVIMVISPT